MCRTVRNKLLVVWSTGGSCVLCVEAYCFVVVKGSEDLLGAVEGVFESVLQRYLHQI